ncbi:energy transducer TonB [Halioglobus pacificus]|uniref:TonB C-terminal domain-containing protein n=1 Tax=Parahalioglobus pacificus TaxID=930806 RepID=A0A918XHV9_9GAMM|nr:hypothetical protein [Halioglobus pacificus]GHD31407.1 hypothetical protein GCM10007053_14410 [Halioglobus pacificus]
MQRGVSLLFIIFLVQVTAAQAHLPALFGRDFKLYTAPTELHPLPQAPGQSDGDAGGDEAADVDAMPASEKAAPFDARLDDEEQLGGPYGQGLVEPLYNKAAYLQRQGDHEDAIRVLQQALHVSRINDGLTSKQQLPILRALMQAYRDADEMRMLDQSWEYMFRLYNLGKEAGEDAQTVSLEYLQWQREAHNSGMDGTARSRMVQAYLTNQRLLEELLAQEQVIYERLRALSLSQLYNLYLLLGMEPVESQLDGLTSGYNHGGRGSSGDWVRHRMERLELSGAVEGENLLNQLIEAASEQPYAERAALYRELGDWCQWNSRYKSADTAYRESVRLLREGGEEQLLQRWLHEPVALPDEEEIWFGAPVIDSEAGPSVLTVRFDLSQRGDVRNAEVVQASVEGRDVRMLRMLRETHFRPRWSNGIPEGVLGVERQYHLLD